MKFVVFVVLAGTAATSQAQSLRALSTSEPPNNSTDVNQADAPTLIPTNVPPTDAPTSSPPVPAATPPPTRGSPSDDDSDSTSDSSDFGFNLNQLLVENKPTSSPSETPTLVPTMATTAPTEAPTAPTNLPSWHPSLARSLGPSTNPSDIPSNAPSNAPTVKPTKQGLYAYFFSTPPPTAEPTTHAPTAKPTSPFLHHLPAAFEMLGSPECHRLNEKLNNAIRGYLEFSDHALVQFYCNPLERRKLVRVVDGMRHDLGYKSEMYSCQAALETIIVAQDVPKGKKWANVTACKTDARAEVSLLDNAADGRRQLHWTALYQTSLFFFLLFVQTIYHNII